MLDAENFHGVRPSSNEVCDERTEDYQLFNISLGDHPILEPKTDLCSAKESWWSDSACARAVVRTIAPLLVSKMITRAFLQPVITLLRWAKAQCIPFHHAEMINGFLNLF